MFDKKESKIKQLVSDFCPALSALSICDLGETHTGDSGIYPSILLFIGVIL